MLAERLNVEDAEQWLEDVPDRVWANWKSAYANNPFGGERELLARITGLLYALLAIQTTKDSREDWFNYVDSMTAANMPPEWIGQPKKKPKPVDSIADFEAKVAAQYG